MLNETHAPDLKSWVESANRSGTDFPIQNLPHGVFRRRDSSEAYRGGVAIGDQILDMSAACSAGAFAGVASDAAEAASASSLNNLMALGPNAWSNLRLALSRALRRESAHADRLRACLVPQDEAEYGVPSQIGDFTDFLTSQFHALNAGRVFNPDNPLLPNFKWLPLAYHARSSSIEVSGAPLIRPVGQTRAPGSDAPTYGPCQRLDYEVELGFFVGPGNRRGEPIGVNAAEGHLFGACLLNDWSARDIQAWEMLPLGPFMGKNFLTTISPWIVTLEALKPYRVPVPREEGDPPALPYLQVSGPLGNRGFDIQLEAWLSTAQEQDSHRLSRSSSRHSYWSAAQLVAHHTGNGCNLAPGDLLGTGTLSGPYRGEEGCLLELSFGGKQPVPLTGGQARSFLEDGDTLTLRGWCERQGFARIGFGECRGTVRATPM